MALFVRIVKWRDFQHYSNRSPPWIKLHRDLLSSRTWVACNSASRVLAVASMMLAAASDNMIPLDPTYIKRVAYLDFDPNFNELLDCQFVEIVDENGVVMGVNSADASKLLALASHSPLLSSVVKGGVGGSGNGSERVSKPRGNGSAKSREVPLPEGFAVSERVRAWAEEHGHGRVVDQHFDAFVSQCRAKGYTYVDWDEALMNAIRKNWAKIEVQGGRRPDGTVKVAI